MRVSDSAESWTRLPDPRAEFYVITGPNTRIRVPDLFAFLFTP